MADRNVAPRKSGEKRAVTERLVLEETRSKRR